MLYESFHLKKLSGIRIFPDFLQISTVFTSDFKTLRYVFSELMIQDNYPVLIFDFFSGFPSNLQISLYFFDRLISFSKVYNHHKCNFSLFSLNLSTIKFNSVYSAHEVGLNVVSLVI